MAKECSNSSCSKESCEGCPSKAGQGKPDFHIDLNADSSIKHVIGVVSGKGGVGKSMVTASLANQKAKEGYKVGILDADITGPSIPKMYGLKGPANVDDKGVYPAVAANGVKVMSINLLLPGEEEPVIWRGPVIAGTVKQFWTDVIWGDLDYLFVDMPPGTGDVPLTVFQSLRSGARYRRELQLPRMSGLRQKAVHFRRKPHRRDRSRDRRAGSRQNADSSGVCRAGGRRKICRSG